MILLLGKLIEFHLIKLSPATEQTMQGQENVNSPSLWPVEFGDPCLCSYQERLPTRWPSVGVIL